MSGGSKSVGSILFEKSRLLQANARPYAHGFFSRCNENSTQIKGSRDNSADLLLLCYFHTAFLCDRFAQVGNALWLRSIKLEVKLS